MDSEKKQTSLLDRWKKSGKNNSSNSSIGKAPETTNIPLSSAQQRLWFLQQLYPTNAFYNVSTAIVFEGPLKVDVLKKCLAEVVNHNKILKSTYPIFDGVPIIKIDENLKFKIDELDFTRLSSEACSFETKKVIEKQVSFQFDLEQGPLFKFVLIKQLASKHVLFLTMHHIVIDLWSIGLLKEQLANSYRSIANGEVLNLRGTEIQYTDYAFWQQNRALNESQFDYWKEKFSGDLPILDLPRDKKNPLIPSFKGQNLTKKITGEFSDKIFGLAKSLDVTPFVLLLSAYYVLLSKHSSQKDITIGSPLSVRNEESLEGILGFFIDTIVLRSSVDAHLSFSELVNQVREDVLDSFSNNEIPFDELVKELKIDRTLSTNPLFQTMFVYDSEQKPLSFGDEIEVIEDFEFETGVSKFDLTLFVKKQAGKLTFTFEYATDVFEESTILRFQEHLKLILETVTINPLCKVNEIQVLTDEEKKFFLNNNVQSDSSFENYRGIHEIITNRSLKSPDAIAAIIEDKSITYQQLVKRAEVIVPQILKYSKGENKIVALMTNRSLEMIVGLLAILKAGCAYLPIDANYPKQRTDFMLTDSGVELILTQRALKDNFDNFDGDIFCVDEEYDARDTMKVARVESNEEHLAYVIYTSGSTGKPKGVPISHKNIIASTAGRLSFYKKTPSVFLLLSSFSFDSSKAGIFWTLCTGGTLLISEKRAEQDLESLAKTIRSYGVSHTLMLPSLYEILLDNITGRELSSLTDVIVAGEACSSFLVKKHFEVLPDTNLYNEYGPTEATVWSIAHKILPENAKTSVPIGKAVAGAQVYLLDSSRSLVPYGAVGEIYIGGKGVSKGYLNRPDLDVDFFFGNPYDFTDGGKLYKTGDFGRYNKDGNLEYLGRGDDQIKIRGHRIELSEIESVISKYAEVQEVVVRIEEILKVKRLVAFVRVSIGFDEKQLRQHLREHLPDYMIPSIFHQIDDFPLLPNGKVDRNALHALERVEVQKTVEGDDSPKNKIELELIKIWQEVLQVSPIGVNDNFFEIGGDSILSIQMLSKARNQNIFLSPNQIFEYQTIRGLGSYIIKNKDIKEEWDYLVPFRTEGEKKPLFCLHAGGGHVFFYKGLIDYIDSDRPLYALQASGVYGKKGMHNSIAEMADDYIKIIKSVQEKGPYNILIYCFSATVGHEISMKMKSSGDHCNLIVMDTMAKPWTLNTPNRLKIRAIGFYKRLLNKPFYTLNHMVSIRLNNLMSQAYKVLGNEQQKTLEELRANLARLSRNYDWKPFDGKISLILTEKPHESLNRETINSWKEYAQGGIKILKTRGSHSFLFKPENLPYVAVKIEECIKD